MVKKSTHRKNVINGSDELPYLSLSISKATAEFETSRTELEAKGLTMEDAIRGFDYLLDKAILKIDKARK